MTVVAYVLVKMKPGTSKEIVGSRLIRGVQMANSVLGGYDAVLVVKADDLQHLSRIIYDVIEKHPNVVATETLLGLF
jgi:DNA-binding Lrp family transcriptional regulator